MEMKLYSLFRLTARRKLTLGKMRSGMQVEQLFPRQRNLVMGIMVLFLLTQMVINSMYFICKVLAVGQNSIYT
jgi:type II secretory pathway component PulM